MTKKQRVETAEKLLALFDQFMEEVGAAQDLHGLHFGRKPKDCSPCGPAPCSTTWYVPTTRGLYHCHCYGNLCPEVSGIGWVAGRFVDGPKKNLHFDNVAPVVAIYETFRGWLLPLIPEKDCTS